MGDMIEKCVSWFEKMLPQQNGIVAPFEPFSMAALACNQSAVTLGGVVQARNALFYLVDYLTKDSNALTNVTSVLRFARNRVNRYQSTVVDKGTSKRDALHLIQAILNNITSRMELSATQAAAILLGTFSYISHVTA